MNFNQTKLSKNKRLKTNLLDSKIYKIKPHKPQIEKTQIEKTQVEKAQVEKAFIQTPYQPKGQIQATDQCLNRPIVSVVIPSYNCAHLLPETIASVQTQSYPDWELLIINDGSTDDTEIQIKQRLETLSDDRIQLISKSNRGVSNTRNFGANLAQGEIIAFLDADDRWLPDHLETHVNRFIHQPELGISFGRVEFLTAGGERTGKTTQKYLYPIPSHHFLSTNPTVTTSNLLVRTSIFKALQGFDESINHSEDMDFLFRASHLTSISGIDRVLVQYRIQTTGLSSTLEKMEKGWYHLIDKARQSHPDLVDRHYNAAHTAQLLYLARQTLRLNLPAHLGLGYLHRAIHSHWPSVVLKPRSILMTIALYAKYFHAKYFQLTRLHASLSKYFS